MRIQNHFHNMSIEHRSSNNLHTNLHHISMVDFILSMPYNRHICCYPRRIRRWLQLLWDIEQEQMWNIIIFNAKPFIFHIFLHGSSHKLIVRRRKFLPTLSDCSTGWTDTFTFTFGTFATFHVFTVNKFRARIQIKRLYLNCVGSLGIVW